MSWPKDVDFALVTWGILLIIGFLITQIFIIYDINFLFNYIGLWVIIVGSGFYLNYAFFNLVKKQSNLLSLIWFLFIIFGFIITTLIYANIITTNPFYLGSIWLITIGSSLIITQGFIKKDMAALITGIVFILFSIPAYYLWEISFIFLAIGFGIPMILLGLYEPGTKKSRHRIR